MDQVRKQSGGSGLGCLRADGERLQVVLEQTDLGSLSLANLAAARRSLAEAAERTANGTLEVELRARVIGASFVAILVRVANRLRSRGGRLKLTNVGPHVREVLAVCGYEWLAK